MFVNGLYIFLANTYMQMTGNCKVIMWPADTFFSRLAQLLNPAPFSAPLSVEKAEQGPGSKAS